MNFLAHLYLSPENDEIILGNFIADAVKGKTINTFSDGIKQGIYLHRAIDEFTDKHPVFKKSKERLRPKYRMYSGVIVDIYYDHFLSKLWDNYSDKSIGDFVKKTYWMLSVNYFILPKISKRVFPFMMIQNWLENYSNLKMLTRVFGGMSRRTNNNSGMEEAVIDLRKDYSKFESEFIEFFPEITKFVRNHKYYKI